MPFISFLKQTGVFWRWSSLMWSNCTCLFFQVFAWVALLRYHVFVPSFLLFWNRMQTDSLNMAGFLLIYYLYLFWFFPLKAKNFPSNPGAIQIKLYTNHAWIGNLGGNLFWHLFKFCQILFVAKSILKICPRKKTPKNQTHHLLCMCSFVEKQPKLNRIDGLWPPCVWLVLGSCKVYL